MADTGLDRGIRDLNAVHADKMDAALAGDAQVRAGWGLDGNSPGLPAAVSDLNRVQADRMKAARLTSGQ